MSLSTNTTYRFLVEKLGASDPTQFIGNEGEVFYDPSTPTLKLSDGSTAGGLTIGGGGGGGGESYWVSTSAGINTLSNVGIGTTNPKTRLEVNGVLGFGTFIGNYGGTRTNIRIGDNTTGANLTSGGDNIFMGIGAGRSNTDGCFNYFIGRDAGLNNTTGDRNTFLGRFAGQCNTTGSRNVVIGDYSYGSCTGNGNFLGGYAIGYGEMEGSYNNFFGWYAGSSSQGDYNNIMGFCGGYNNFGCYNNFFGYCAGFYNNACHNNFLGYNAGKSNTTGGYNNFFGREAGLNNTTGNANNFIGCCAGYCNSGGYNNNFIGVCAGYYNTSSCHNNFFGTYAGFCNITGGSNNFLGYRAGFCNTTGNNNTFLGSYTGISTSASNKIILGRGNAFNQLFDSPDTDKDTQFAVGIRTDANPSKYWLVGNENFNVGIGTTNPTSKLTVQSGDVRIGINTSQGIILTDQNGVAWRLHVNTDGTLGTSAV